MLDVISFREQKKGWDQHGSNGISILNKTISSNVSSVSKKESQLTMEVEMEMNLPLICNGSTETSISPNNVGVVNDEW